MLFIQFNMITVIKMKNEGDPLITENYRHQVIDTYLLYWGRVQRKDLVRHLGIGNVTATRIFNDYSTKNPGERLFDPSKKAYVYTDSFSPLTIPSPESVLPLLAHGMEQKQLRKSVV